MRKKNENPEWNTGCLKAIGISFIIVLIVWIFVMDFKNIRENRNICEEVGGKYQVVGEEFSAAHRRTIDVYGCAK